MPEEKHDTSLAPFMPLVDSNDRSSSSAPAGTTHSPTNPPPREEQEIIRDLASDASCPREANPPPRLSGAVSSMHTSTSYLLPPSNIDFASGSVDLRPPYLPTPCRFICSSCVWLGGTREECTAWDNAWQEGVVGQYDPPGSYYQWRMTFGLLEKLVGHEIPEYFLVIRPRDGPATFSGDNLSALFRDWMTRAEQTEERWDSGWVASMRSALTDILDMIDQESQYSDLTQSFKRMGINQPVAFNITLTVCELTSAVLDILHDFGAHYHLTESDRVLLDDLTTLPIYMVLDSALNLVRTKQWCRFNESLIKNHGFTVQAYACTCDPFNRGGAEAHNACTIWDCKVNNIDTQNYINKHVSEKCACSHTRPLYEDVAACLSSGQIPVVVPHDAGLVVRRSTNVPYIAISHVWADGLGSHTERGLPQCQIERLTAMVCSLDVDTAVAFWIDGLCIPADRALRKKAIALMAQTYYDATAVLVLDAGILACNSHAPLEEQLLRVITSGKEGEIRGREYSTSIYVKPELSILFQEALLVRKLFLAFSDEFVNADDLMRHNNPDTGRPSMDKPAPSLLTVAEVSRSLMWRSTSKPEDETLAIAGLVGADAKELIDMDDPDTMSVGNDTATCSRTGLLANYIVVRLNTTTHSTTRTVVMEGPNRSYLYALTSYKSDYEFNAVLVNRVPHHLGPGSTARCVIVRGFEVDPEDPVGGRFVCEFLEQGSLTDITNGDPEKLNKTLPITPVHILEHVQACEFRVTQQTGKYGLLDEAVFHLYQYNGYEVVKVATGIYISSNGKLSTFNLSPKLVLPISQRQYASGSTHRFRTEEDLKHWTHARPTTIHLISWLASSLACRRRSLEKERRGREPRSLSRDSEAELEIIQDDMIHSVYKHLITVVVYRPVLPRFTAAQIELGRKMPLAMRPKLRRTESSRRQNIYREMGRSRAKIEIWDWVRIQYIIVLESQSNQHSALTKKKIKEDHRHTPRLIIPTSTAQDRARSPRRPLPQLAPLRHRPARIFGNKRKERKRTALFPLVNNATTRFTRPALSCASACFPTNRREGRERRKNEGERDKGSEPSADEASTAATSARHRHRHPPDSHRRHRHRLDIPSTSTRVEADACPMRMQALLPPWGSTPKRTTALALCASVRSLVNTTADGRVSELPTPSRRPHLGSTSPLVSSSPPHSLPLPVSPKQSRPQCEPKNSPKKGPPRRDAPCLLPCMTNVPPPPKPSTRSAQIRIQLRKKRREERCTTACVAISNNRKLRFFVLSTPSSTSPFERRSRSLELEADFEDVSYFACYASASIYILEGERIEANHRKRKYERGMKHMKENGNVSSKERVSTAQDERRPGPGPTQEQVEGATQERKPDERKEHVSILMKYISSPKQIHIPSKKNTRSVRMWARHGNRSKRTGEKSALYMIRIDSEYQYKRKESCSARVVCACAGMRGDNATRENRESSSEARRACSCDTSEGKRERKHRSKRKTTAAGVQNAPACIT
ncbi:hypothetical protein C8R45DRAFT_1076617 [Mycena sanguinolenta]|nr:hypothetical protein C8R45DRAFT_1076617 [Mycena sanguinolenta]